MLFAGEGKPEIAPATPKRGLARWTNVYQPIADEERRESSQPTAAPEVSTGVSVLMPAPPRWILAVRDAVRQLEGLDRDLLTRRDLERLSRARAAQLMRTFGAELAGSSRVLRRADLLRRQLKRLRGRAVFRHEEQRRSRVVAELRTARVSGIRVAVPVEVVEVRLTGLPEGVTVGADRIEVRFAGAKEAVVKLFALAQALTHDTTSASRRSSGRGSGWDERGAGAGAVGRPGGDRAAELVRGRAARGDRRRGACGRRAVPGVFRGRGRERADAGGLRAGRGAVPGLVRRTRPGPRRSATGWSSTRCCPGTRPRRPGGRSTS